MTCMQLMSMDVELQQLMMMMIMIMMNTKCQLKGCVLSFSHNILLVLPYQSGLCIKQKDTHGQE